MATIYHQPICNHNYQGHILQTRITFKSSMDKYSHVQ